MKHERVRLFMYHFRITVSAGIPCTSCRLSAVKSENSSRLMSYNTMYAYSISHILELTLYCVGSCFLAVIFLRIFSLDLLYRY